MNDGKSLLSQKSCELHELMQEFCYFSDINECTRRPVVCKAGSCVNVPGSFQCQCPPLLFYAEEKCRGKGKSKPSWVGRGVKSSQHVKMTRKLQWLKIERLRGEGSGGGVVSYITYISRLNLIFPIIPVLGGAVIVPLIFPSSD